MEDVGGTFPGVWMIRAVGEPIDDSPPADLDDSGEVNVADLLILLGEWGACGGAICPADLNDSGVVDVTDLLELLGAWG